MANIQIWDHWHDEMKFIHAHWCRSRIQTWCINYTHFFKLFVYIETRCLFTFLLVLAHLADYSDQEMTPLYSSLQRYTAHSFLTKCTKSLSLTHLGASRRLRGQKYIKARLILGHNLTFFDPPCGYAGGQFSNMRPSAWWVELTPHPLVESRNPNIVY